LLTNWRRYGGLPLSSNLRIPFKYGRHAFPLQIH
jgi:hypothetical protein